MVLLAAPLLAVAVALGSVPAVAPIPAPQPVPLPVSIQLSLTSSPAYAEIPLQVQALVTTRLGTGPGGTVNFTIEGVGTSVGSPVSTTTHTAIAKIGAYVTGPVTVDATFVPTGGSAVTTSARQTFEVIGQDILMIATAPSSVASGTSTKINVTLNRSSAAYPIDGVVNVFVDAGSTRSGYCVPGPGALLSISVCTATIASLGTGTHKLNVTLDDSNYYTAQATRTVVVTPPAAPAPKSGSSAPTTPATSTPTATATADPTMAPAVDAPNAEPAAHSSPSSGQTQVPFWLWPLLLAVLVLGSVGVVIIRRRRHRAHADAASWPR